MIKLKTEREGKVTKSIQFSVPSDTPSTHEAAARSASEWPRRWPKKILFGKCTVSPSSPVQAFLWQGLCFLHLVCRAQSRDNQPREVHSAEVPPGDQRDHLHLLTLIKRVGCRALPFLLVSHEQQKAVEGERSMQRRGDEKWDHCVESWEKRAQKSKRPLALDWQNSCLTEAGSTFLSGRTLEKDFSTCSIIPAVRVGMLSLSA
jgi:hypothetical protein